MHDDERLLRMLFVLIWVITLIHVAAEMQYWYWTYRWLDLPMHVLGGMWVGLVALWLWYYSGYQHKTSRIAVSPLTVALVGGLVFGVAWEAYEFLVWIIGAGLPVNYVTDSVLDLVMDVLGASIAFMFYQRFFAIPSSHTLTE